jgi:hypothetical protein
MQVYLNGIEIPEHSSGSESMKNEIEQQQKQIVKQRTK